jgi:hypothetical protein
MVINGTDQRPRNATRAKVFSLLTNTWLILCVAAFLWIRIANSQMGQRVIQRLGSHPGP